jgi:hypothetical protein
MWGDNTNVSSSYFFNYGDNDRTSTLDRTFVAAQNAGQLYAQQDTALSINRSHRFNMRIESYLDSANVIAVSPRVSVQASNSNSLVSGLTSFLGQGLNSTMTDNDATSNGYSASVSTTYRRLMLTVMIGAMTARSPQQTVSFSALTRRYVSTSVRMAHQTGQLLADRLPTPNQSVSATCFSSPTSRHFR